MHIEERIKSDTESPYKNTVESILETLKGKSVHEISNILLEVRMAIDDRSILDPH